MRHNCKLQIDELQIANCRAATLAAAINAHASAFLQFAICILQFAFFNF